MKDLEIDEVCCHELALTNGRKKADDSHDSRLESHREDDPHQVSRHEVGGKFGYVLNIFVELSRVECQIAIIDRQNDAANSEEKARAPALHLLV